jgi:ATP-binding cassette subfamily F protein uup
VLTIKNLTLRFGGPPLLDRVSLVVERGERVCVLGRNGEGKSTLLRIIAGTQVADDGEVIKAPGMRIAEMPQDIPASLPGTVRDVVASGLGEIGQVLAEYHHLLTESEHAEPKRLDQILDRMGKLQGRLDAGDGWTLDARVESIVTRLELPGDTLFNDLSGGYKRRALLGRALALEPDLLLLDEPTNHLDLDSIAWIENFLLSWPGALLFITHDRAFLRRLATRIVELDRGQLTSWPGDYENYLRRREERLASEAKTQFEFDKKLAQEEVWIRKGIQARRTRDMGRVGRLLEMRKQYAERRNLQGKAEFIVQEAAASGKLVAEAKNVGYSVGGRTILRNVSLNVIRGDKIGIIGPNGAGKTTLLNLLLGRLQPSSGELKTGTNIEVAWFDQMRATLDENKPVWENIAGGKEFVTIGEGDNAKRKHVMGYLQEFLFTPDRARSPTRVLSGGERARLLLAQLFSQPANLLVLDEPTNDLDVETLDLLEDLLLDFAGTVLVVSHDRAFLDNVVTRTLAFEGGGRVAEYVGGYSDWLRQRPAPVAVAATRPAVRAAEAPVVVPPPVAATQALSPKEKRELQELPARIEKLEAEIAKLGESLAELYGREPAKAVEVQKRVSALNEELSSAYQRWERLEAHKSL